jgi:hypothetical protein
MICESGWEIGDYGFTAKARRSQRDAKFFEVKRNAELRRSRRKTRRKLRRVFSPPRGQGRQVFENSDEGRFWIYHKGAKVGEGREKRVGR